jgi:phage shock protein A
MGRSRDLAEEIAGLEDDDRVEDALAALKAKVGKSDKLYQDEQEK